MSVSDVGAKTTSSPAIAFVLTHPQMGIYLGCCMGLGFWSKLDPGGQPSACAFPSIEEAKQHMFTWDGGVPEGVTFAEVIADEPGYVSIAACVAAGLVGWVDEYTPVANEHAL